MKFLVYVPVWGRHEALELFANNMKALGIDKVVAIASTHEDYIICRNYGWKVIAHSNTPLGAKLQAGLHAIAIEKIDFDIIGLMGADNTISSLEPIIKAFNEGCDFVAFNECLFTHRLTGESILWTGYKNYRKGEPIGAGRFLSKQLIEKLNYELWPPTAIGTEDRNAYLRIRQESNKCRLLNWKDCELRDYKDDESATNFDKIRQWKEQKKRFFFL